MLKICKSQIITTHVKVGFLLVLISLTNCGKVSNKSNVNYYLDPAKIEHFEGYAYKYKINHLRLPLFKALAFQNFIEFYDNDKPLRVYYASDSINPRYPSIKDAKGFYIFAKRENDIYLLFSPKNKKPSPKDKRRFLVQYKGPNWPEVHMCDVNNLYETKLNKTNIFFPENTISGVEFKALEKVSVAFGANGYNLFNYKEIIDSMKTFYPDRKIDTNIEDFAITLVDFFKKHSIVRTGNAFIYPSALDIISLGSGHCGNLSCLPSAIASLFGYEYYRFGATNNVWGHTLNLLRHHNKNYVVSLYDDLVLEYKPGDTSVSETSLINKMLKYHDSNGAIGIKNNYIASKKFYQDYGQYRWIASILRSGQQITYGSQPIKKSEVMFDLQKGDKLIIDSRVISSMSKSTLLKYFYNEKVRRNHIDSMAVFVRKYENKVDDNFSFPLPIRHIIIDTDDDMSIEIYINKKKQTDLKTANLNLKKKLLVYHLRIKSARARSIALVMQMNPYLLKLKKNTLDNFYAKKMYPNTDYDKFYHTLKEGREYVTVAWKWGSMPDIKLLKEEDLSKIHKEFFNDEGIK